MTDAAVPRTAPRLVDWACLRACWRLGRAPARYRGSDSAFTYLGAMLLVIGASLAIDNLAPQFAFELSLLVLLACLAPAVIRRLRALGPAVGLLALSAALALGTAATMLRGQGPTDLPLAWQVLAIALSRETQLGLLALALAPARRQTGSRRRLRLGLLLVLGGTAAVAAALS